MLKKIEYPMNKKAISESNKNIMSYNTIAYRASLLHYRWRLLRWLFRHNEAVLTFLMTSIILVLGSLFLLVVDIFQDQYPEWVIVFNIYQYGWWIPATFIITNFLVFVLMMRVNHTRKEWDESWKVSIDCPAEVIEIISQLEKKQKYSAVACPCIKNSNYAMYWILTKGYASRNRWTRESTVHVVV